MRDLVMPFGMYRGERLELVAQDDGYCRWLFAQTWFASTTPRSPASWRVCAATTVDRRQLTGCRTVCRCGLTDAPPGDNCCTSGILGAYFRNDVLPAVGSCAAPKAGSLPVLGALWRTASCARGSP